MCVGSIQYVVIETFCPLGTYFDQRVLKHFQPKIYINILIYIKCLCIFFNAKLIDVTILTKKSDEYLLKHISTRPTKICSRGKHFSIAP